MVDYLNVRFSELAYRTGGGGMSICAPDRFVLRIVIDLDLLVDLYADFQLWNRCFAGCPCPYEVIKVCLRSRRTNGMSIIGIEHNGTGIARSGAL